MKTTLSSQKFINGFLKTASGYDSSSGNPRVKEIVHRLLTDLCVMIDDLNINEDEFWAGVNYLVRLGQSHEPALLAAGLGLERAIDIRLDDLAEKEGLLSPNATPRTIEGPLHVSGAPIGSKVVRMDDGTDHQSYQMYLHGQVRDTEGRPIPNATVEVWHANSLGNYSYFDQTQSAFNLRRTIQADEQGFYVARSIMPGGYGCPPEGPTQELLNLLGRHGNRPAHVHFFVHAPGYIHLTTQINMHDDPYCFDDFAYATREELVVNETKVTDEEQIKAHGMERAYFDVQFDITLVQSEKREQEKKSSRPRAAA